MISVIRSYKAPYSRLVLCLLLLVVLVSPSFADPLQHEQAAEAEALDKEVVKLYRQGRYADAIRQAEKALEIREAILDPWHPDMATSLSNLATLFQSMGDYGRAMPLFTRALAIEEKTAGPLHADTALRLNNLGALFEEMGEYAKAELLLKRALTIREKALDPLDPDIAASLNNLAAVYEGMGEYLRAEPLYVRALAIHENTRGPWAVETATSLNNLGKLLTKIGDYAGAEPLYDRALAIREKVLGPWHRSTATTLNNLAGLYASLGDAARAEPLYTRALAIHEKALGPEHPSTATSLDNLASLYEHTGDYVRAEPLYDRALAIREKTLSPSHPDIATSLNNLAALYQDRSEYARAAPFYLRALGINEKAAGPSHPDTATNLNNLADLYRVMGEYSKARPLYTRALTIRRTAFGLRHPSTAVSVGNLAKLYWSMADYDEAQRLFTQALAIDEESLGADHPDTVTSASNLALLLCETAQRGKALSLARRAAAGDAKNLANVLSFAPENHRLSFVAGKNPYSLVAYLNSAQDIALAVLQWKGAVLSSILEDRALATASTDPEQREIISRMRSLKQRLFQVTFGTPKGTSVQTKEIREAKIARLKSELDKIESSLAREVAGVGKGRQRLSVTVERVQDALPPKAALIEFLRYKHYLGKNRWEDRYGAIIVLADGSPKWVPLGGEGLFKAGELDKRVGDCLRLASSKESVESALRARLQELYRVIWLPVKTALPNENRTVILSPDGSLNFLPFAVLLSPEDHFLCEEKDLRFVATGRDLLVKESEKKREAGAADFLVFASPDFGSPVGHGNRRAISPTIRDLANLQLDPLPGTEIEAKLLEGRATAWNLRVEITCHADATEQVVSHVRSPKILHLATHGFFLPELDIGEDRSDLSGVSGVVAPLTLTNPMHRSGVALTGAQSTLNAWKQGEVPDSTNDGVLTAEEAGGLQLEGTWLVTLSACETASGQPRAGEGVMGLRRGFAQAGTRNLLMTLWSVQDGYTAEFMVKFYNAALQSANPPEALATIQSEELKRLDEEEGLAEAVRLAGPFILTFQGRKF